MKTYIGTGLLVAALGATPLFAQADERPPAEAKPLVDIIAGIEEAPTRS